MKQVIYLTEEDIRNMVLEVLNESEDENMAGAAAKIAARGVGKLMRRFGKNGAKAVENGAEAVAKNGGIRDRFFNSTLGNKIFNNDFANKYGLNFAKQHNLKAQQAGLTKNIGREQASIDKISGELANKNGKYYTKKGKLNGTGRRAKRDMQGAQSRNAQNNIDLGSVNNQLDAMKNARTRLVNRTMIGSTLLGHINPFGGGNNNNGYNPYYNQYYDYYLEEAVQKTIKKYLK